MGLLEVLSCLQGDTHSDLPTTPRHRVDFTPRLSSTCANDSRIGCCTIADLHVKLQVKRPRALWLLPLPALPLNRWWMLRNGSTLVCSLACEHARTNPPYLSTASLRPSLHSLHLLLHLPKTTVVAVTAEISEPALSLHPSYIAVCCSTNPDSCRPSCNTTALPSLNPEALI